MRRRLATLLVLGASFGLAAPAGAEIVFFSSGRTMSVKAHREQGDRLVLLLPGGGEVVCARDTVVRIAPDEMPAFEEPPRGAMPLLPSDYDEMIESASARHQVDSRLVRAVIQVESAYRAEARSRKGAMGLMQLMPATARRFEVADPYDPEANIEGGTRYLRFLLDRFDPALALAAYNAGEAAVERFGGIPPYAETRAYVRSVMKLAGLPQ